MNSPSHFRHFLSALCITLLQFVGAAKAQNAEAPPKAIPIQASTTNYRISPNDVVKVTVFQEDDLETVARVAQDGKVSIPYIGSVDLAGRTTLEGAKSIEARLREYYTHPQVAVRVMEYSKRTFTVLGQVARPASYEIPPESSVNLIEAIGMAGGYTRIANPAKITLKRIGRNGEESILKLDAKKMSTDPNVPRIKVQPGDNIFVPESIF